MPKFYKKVVVKDSLTTVDRVVLCASEFLGTGILVFLGCMGCVDNIAGGSIPHLQISLTFGIAVMLAIQCTAHISGGHINPIVTLAAAVLGNLPLVQVPIYFLGQFAGAVAGYGALKAVTPSNYFVNNTQGEARAVGICSPAFNHDLSSLQALLTEFLLSLMLVLICCAVWDKRNTDKHDSVTIRFGLTVAALAMAGGPYTGANMNPARSFAPALWNGDWDAHWVYWVGPLLAGALGGLFYRIVFKQSESEEQGAPAEGHPLNQVNDKV